VTLYNKESCSSLKLYSYFFLLDHNFENFQRLDACVTVWSPVHLKKLAEVLCAFLISLNIWLLLWKIQRV